jgi:hypothetical protein
MPSIGIADKQTLDLVYGAVQNAGSGVKMQYPEDGMVIRDRVVQLKTNGKIANLPEEKYEDWASKNILLPIYSGVDTTVIDMVQITALTDTKFLAIYTTRTTAPAYATIAQAFEIKPDGSIIKGAAISLATEAAYTDGSRPQAINIVRIDETRALAFYNRGTSGGQIRVISVSGLTATAGTASSIGGTACHNTDFTALDASRYLFLYTDTANASYGTACVVTVSGTSVSLGSAIVVIASAVCSVSSSLLSPDKVAVIVGHSTTSTTLRVFEINGFDITAGTAVSGPGRLSTSTNGEQMKVARLKDDTFVVAVRATSNITNLRACTVNGTTITQGSTFVGVGTYAFGVVPLSESRFTVANNGATGLYEVSGTTITRLRLFADNADNPRYFKTLSTNDWYNATPGSAYVTLRKMKLSESNGLSRPGLSFISEHPEAASLASLSIGFPRISFAQFGEYLLTTNGDNSSPFKVFAYLSKYDEATDTWTEVHKLQMVSAASQPGEHQIVQIDDTRFLIAHRASTRFYYNVVSVQEDQISIIASGNKASWSTNITTIKLFKLKENTFAALMVTGDPKAACMVFSVDAAGELVELSNFMLPSTGIQATYHDVVYLGFLGDSFTFGFQYFTGSSTVNGVYYLRPTSNGYEFTFATNTGGATTGGVTSGLIPVASNGYISYNRDSSAHQYTVLVKVSPRAGASNPALFQSTQTAGTFNLLTQITPVRVGKRFYLVSNTHIQEAYLGSISTSDILAPNPFSMGGVQFFSTSPNSFTCMNSFFFRGRIWQIAQFATGFAIFSPMSHNGTAVGYIQADGNVVIEGIAQTTQKLAPGTPYGYDASTGELKPDVLTPIGYAVGENKLLIKNQLSV